MDIFLYFSITLATMGLTVQNTQFTTQLNEPKSYKDYKVFGVRCNNSSRYLLELKQFLENAYPQSIHVDSYGKRLKAIVSPEVVETFFNIVGRNHCHAWLIHEDFSKIVDMEKSDRRSGSLAWVTYYDIDDINKFLQEMATKYPDTAKMAEGGRSFEKRVLLGLRINSPTVNASSKPAIIIESGIHGNEWAGPATATYFINQLLSSQDPNITYLRNRFDWHIFPVINPDGYHFSFVNDRLWRKTRSTRSYLSQCVGVDANRNWPFDWQSSQNPCDVTFGGRRPFSELETRTFSQYISKVSNLHGYIALHGNTQMVLLPYSNSFDHVDNYMDLHKICESGLMLAKKVNNAEYSGPGTAAECLYPTSGASMDWVRKTLRVPLVYTVETREPDLLRHGSKLQDIAKEVTQLIHGTIARATEMGYFQDVYA